MWFFSGLSVCSILCLWFCSNVLSCVSCMHPSHNARALIGADKHKNYLHDFKVLVVRRHGNVLDSLLFLVVRFAFIFAHWCLVLHVFHLHYRKTIISPLDFKFSKVHLLTIQSNNKNFSPLCELVLACAQSILRLLWLVSSDEKEIFFYLRSKIYILIHSFTFYLNNILFLYIFMSTALIYIFCFHDFFSIFFHSHDAHCLFSKNLPLISMIAAVLTVFVPNWSQPLLHMTERVVGHGVWHSMPFRVRVLLFACGVCLSWFGLHSRFPLDLLLSTPMYVFAIKVSGDLALKNLDLVSLIVLYICVCIKIMKDSHLI